MSGRQGSRSIGVIGAGTVVGAAVAAALAGRRGEGSAEGLSLTAIGPRRTGAETASWRVVDLLDPRLATKLKGLDEVVIVHVDPNVEPAPQTSVAPPALGAVTDAVRAAVQNAGITRVTLVSSTTVLGARADNDVPLPDDAPLRCRAQVGPVAEYAHLERTWTEWAQHDATRSLAIVRAAMLVGPGIDTSLTRYFESPRVLVVDDDRPPWQLTHVDDLASAVAHVVAGGHVGVFNAVDGTLREHDDLVRRLGLRPFRVPAAVATGTADRLHRLGVTPSPPDELDYVRFPWVVAGDHLAEAGWTPVRSADEVIDELAATISARTAIAGRRVTRPDAASLGAAGAAAAVLGAAALVRARRRRGL
jgi:nucleoside-diphosphate-sugar epimerase